MLQNKFKKRKKRKFGLPLQQNVLWLQVAVDELGLIEDGQRVQNLRSEKLDQVGREAPEVVHLDQLVEVYAQELADKTEVVTEDERVSHA